MLPGAPISLSLAVREQDKQLRTFKCYSALQFSVIKAIEILERTPGVLEVMIMEFPKNG